MTDEHDDNVVPLYTGRFTMEDRLFNDDGGSPIDHIWKQLEIEYRTAEPHLDAGELQRKVLRVMLQSLCRTVQDQAKLRELDVKDALKYVAGVQRRYGLPSWFDGRGPGDKYPYFKPDRVWNDRVLGAFDVIAKMYSGEP